MCIAVLGGVYIGRDTGSPTVLTAERVAITGQVADPDIFDTDNFGMGHPEQPTIPVPQVLDIVIHIDGAVYYPGVFTLPYGSRVNDALALAGGATEEADLSLINLAAFLHDAQQVIIPTAYCEIPEPSFQTAATQNGGLININTASVSDLTALPGIGPVRAENIVNHRETNGPFTSIDQLTNVPQIGSGTLENVRTLITVE